MWIAIHLPHLPLEIFSRGSSTPEPLAVEEQHRILACDRKAAARGVRLGMAASAALALVPNLRALARDTAAETEALLGLAAWAGQFTPGVALEFPATLLLDVAGSLTLFGGLAPLRQKLRAGVAEMGYSAVFAGAPTPRAAAWLAWAGQEKFITEAGQLHPALRPLPVAILCREKHDVDVLDGMGVRTFGDLRALPREGIARRFGQALLDHGDRALGDLADPRTFFVPPAQFSAALELPAEVSQAEALLFAARRLIVQLAGFLAARCGGVQRFQLRLAHREGATPITVGLVEPSRDAEHFTLLLRERLANLALREPVRAISLDARDVMSLPGGQAQLLLEEGKPEGHWPHLVEHLRARLGSESVHGLACSGEHRPERASVVAEPGGKQLQFEFGERPVWLLDRPRPLREIGAVPHHEGPLELLAGPERIESGWWDGDGVGRDYFVARMQSEALVWVFRERLGDGGWFLHGVFA